MFCVWSSGKIDNLPTVMRQLELPTVQSEKFRKHALDNKWDVTMNHVHPLIRSTNHTDPYIDFFFQILILSFSDRLSNGKKLMHICLMNWSCMMDHKTNVKNFAWRQLSGQELLEWLNQGHVEMEVRKREIKEAHSTTVKKLCTSGNL